MKFLRAVRLINWHLYVDYTFSFAGSALITGESGAGKSTLLDAIQFANVGDARRVRFNASAQDGKDSQRSLLTYLRGKTGTESQRFLRNKDFTSYIALEWYDDRRQKPFLTGVGFDVTVNPEDYHTVFFKVEDQSLADSLFLRPSELKEGAMEPRGAEHDFRHHIKQLRGDVYTSAELYRQALKAKFGNVSDRFFTLLIKAMSFQPLADFRRFVCDYMLDERPINLDVMRDNLQNHRHFEVLAKEVSQKVRVLATIAGKDEELQQVEDWIQQQDAVILSAEIGQAQDDLARRVHDQEEHQQNALDWRRGAETLESNRAELESERDQLQSQLNADRALLNAQELDRRIAEITARESALHHQTDGLVSWAQQELDRLETATVMVAQMPEVAGMSDPLQTLVNGSGVMNPLLHRQWQVEVPATTLGQLALAAEQLGEVVQSRRFSWQQRQKQVAHEQGQLTLARKSVV